MSVETLYQAAGADQPVFRRSMFTVGIGTQDGNEVVLIHVTMGEHKFEFRLTPENAREIGAVLIARSDLIA